MLVIVITLIGKNMGKVFIRQDDSVCQVIAIQNYSFAFQLLSQSTHSVFLKLLENFPSIQIEKVWGECNLISQVCMWWLPS